MTTLTQAHRQWASRPADERFTSLTELQAFAALSRETSRSTVVSTRAIELIPADGDHRGLLIGARDGTQAAPTHWSFGQLCSLASTPSPASYFRESGRPTPIIADCLNYNLRFTRGVEDVKLLVSGQGNGVELRAATGPRYGRIWNADVVDALVERFGDGVSGLWRVPGIFGQRITVDKSNTTLYASDRDMFVFLADEDAASRSPTVVTASRDPSHAASSSGTPKSATPRLAPGSSSSITSAATAMSGVRTNTPRFASAIRAARQNAGSKR
jgi:hypothetical protein